MVLPIEQLLKNGKRVTSCLLPRLNKHVEGLGLQLLGVTYKKTRRAQRNKVPKDCSLWFHIQESPSHNDLPRVYINV
jgi:hypothetical protein